MTTPTPDWHARARTLAINGHAFVDGRYVAAASGATFDCVSPIDGRMLTQVASTDIADADLAVAAARRAFESGTWSRQSPRERKRVLLRFAQLIEQHNLSPQKVAVELNRRLIRSDKYGTVLKAGDEVEIVTFVGGGA